MDFLEFNRNLIAEFRANNGEVTGQFAGSPLLLLTTTGAKSGLPRTSPLVYSKDGENVVIIASKGGAPSHPAGLNLLPNKSAMLEMGPQTFAVSASIAEGDERRRLFDQQAALLPNFKEYEAATSREIPVVVLTRV